MTMHEEIQQIIQEFPEMNEILYRNSERFFDDWLQNLPINSETVFKSCNGDYLLEFYKEEAIKISFKSPYFLSPYLLIIEADTNKEHLSLLSRAAYIICILRDRISGNTERDFLKVADIYDEIYELYKLSDGKKG